MFDESIDDSIFEPIDGWEPLPSLHNPGGWPLVQNPFAWDDEEKQS